MELISFILGKLKDEAIWSIEEEQQVIKNCEKIIGKLQPMHGFLKFEDDYW